MDAVRPARWDDFAALFDAQGCPGYCWCVPYRSEHAQDMDRSQRREAMRQLITQGMPVGVLAYDDGPIGWCSVAPRSTFPKLARSRVMPEVDPDAWTVTCLFVRRDHRGTGWSKRLLAGGLAYVRAQGARVVEAYPWDTAGITSQHWGHSHLFRQAGFARDGTSRRWVRRL